MYLSNEVRLTYKDDRATQLTRDSHVILYLVIRSSPDLLASRFDLIINELDFSLTIRSIDIAIIYYCPPISQAINHYFEFRPNFDIGDAHREHHHFQQGCSSTSVVVTQMRCQLSRQTR